jgi:hypothetical protein
MFSHKKYWFPRRRDSFGWGLPMTWQGWVCFFVWLDVLLMALVWYVNRVPTDGSEFSLTATAIFLAVVTLDGLALALACLKRGQPLR